MSHMPKIDGVKETKESKIFEFSLIVHTDNRLVVDEVVDEDVESVLLGGIKSFNFLFGALTSAAVSTWL